MLQSHFYHSSTDLNRIRSSLYTVCIVMNLAAAAGPDGTRRARTRGCKIPRGTARWPGAQLSGVTGTGVMPSNTRRRVNRDNWFVRTIVETLFSRGHAAEQSHPALSTPCSRPLCWALHGQIRVYTKLAILTILRTSYKVHWTIHWIHYFIHISYASRYLDNTEP